MTTRVLPHSLEAEASVIGAVMIRPTLKGEISLDEDDFHDPRHRVVWGALARLADKHRAIDETTLESELRDEGKFEAIGGFALLSHLANLVPTADNVAHYVEIVRDKRLTRDIILACAEVAGMGYGYQEGADELLGEAMRRLSEIAVGSGDETSTIGSIIRERFKELGEVAAAKARGEVGVVGLPTGIANLDRKLAGGIQRGIVTVGCARPGHGKSSFGLTVARAVAQAGLGVHVFSLEDTREVYSDRAMAVESYIAAERIRSVDFRDGELAKLGIAAQTYWALRDRWKVDDRSGIGADELVRAVRRHARENKTALVVVDYIHLLNWPRDARREDQAITRNMKTLADAAKADRMAYLVLSQLNRECEKRDDKRPRLSDLRESGGLEERSRCVLAFYRGCMYGPPGGDDKDSHGMPPTEEQWQRRLEIGILKQSQGQTGRVWASFDAPTLRMQ